jgi:hypothetical protein
MPRIEFLLEVALTATGAGMLGAAGHSWPQVAPLRVAVYFADASHADATFTIFHRTTREPAYRVDCHHGGYDLDSTFDYSGDFECRLLPLYASTKYSTLFTEDPAQSRDWESRARFLADQLVGGCATYPEWGRIRHFRVRGMRITLELDRIAIGYDSIPNSRTTRPVLKAFGFSINVVPDSTVTSEITEPAGVQEPPYVHPEEEGNYLRRCSM